MIPLKRWVIVGGAIVAVGGACLWAYGALYARPLAEKREALATAKENIRRFEQALEARRDVRVSLASLASHTLGDKRDLVEHRFRTMLTGIAQETGLRDVEVTSRAPEGLRNPAGSSRLTDRRLLNSFRGQVDGYMIRGQITGAGTLEQVLSAMALASAQPWVSRIESFRISPEGRERDRFSLRMSVATLYVPDLVRSGHSEPARMALSGEAREAFAGIVAKNMFKEPPPVRTARAPNPAPPPQVNSSPPPPPYHEWRLAGISESPRQGVQAMVVNMRTNQYVFLAAGEKIIEAVFLDGEGERAVFSVGDEWFEVFNGQSLSERMAIESGQGISAGPGGISRK